jgi:hypothetical protein
MTTYQEIRAHFEQPVVDVCADLGIEYRPENTLEPGGDAASEFLLSRIQFGTMTESTLCELLENIRGTFIVEFYCPKGEGPARAQNVIHDVFCALVRTPGVLSISGPNFTALNEQPYFFASLSTAIIVSPNTFDSTSNIGGGGGSSGGGGGGGGGGGTTEDITTADVDLTNPTRAAYDKVDTTVITPPPPNLTTQEDANQYFAQALDELDEALEDHKDYTDIADLDELV